MNCHLHKMGLLGLLTLIGCLVGGAQPSQQNGSINWQRLSQEQPERPLATLRQDPSSANADTHIGIMSK